MTDADHTRPGLADAAGRAALFPAPGGRARLARPDRGCRRRRPLGAGGGAGRRPRPGRLAPGGCGAVARPPPRARTDRGRARRQRRAGPTRRGGARQPAHARADRQCPRERGDAASDPSRHLEPRAEGRDRAADGWARRGGGGRRPRLVDAFRPARRAARETPRDAPVRGHRHPGARPRSGHGPRDRPLHGADGRPRTGGVARRRPRFRLDRGCVPRLGWLFLSGVYFVLFWSGAGQTPGCACCGCGSPPSQELGPPRCARSRASSACSSRSRRSSPASSRCSSRRRDADSPTSSRAPSWSTTSRPPPAGLTPSPNRCRRPAQSGERSRGRGRRSHGSPGPARLPRRRRPADRE